jgi:NAD(P)-dependent dehydrogenase (short-subunit alcohol dehydrogenase family)
MSTLALLAGRRAIVTGGASGIGAQIVEEFAEAGAAGAVLDLPGTLDRELPDTWTGVPVDVRDDAAVAAAIEQAGEPVDVLVAAAGIVPPWAGIASIDPEVWDDVLNVNARGVMSTIRHAAPRMRKGAAIVVIASLNAWRGDPNIAAYVASKHAVLGLVRSAALDLGRRGIRVNAIAPGPIATEALLGRIARREQELGIPAGEALTTMAGQTALGRIATVEEVASASLFLASDLASGITGHMLPVDGGIA